MITAGRLALASLLLVIPMAGCAGPSGYESVTGTLTYRERMALPSDAVITVSLVDVSRIDAPAIKIATTEFSADGKQVPFQFVLGYLPSGIDSTHSYVVQSSITSAEGDLLFTTTEAYPVITRGAASSVDMVLERVAAATLETGGAASRAGRLLLAAEALHFIPCSESGPGILLEDGTGGEAASIVRSLGGEGQEVTALVTLEGNRLVAVRYAALEGTSCQSLPTGTDVVARGNEPFWSATVSGNVLTVRTPEDSARYAGRGWTQPTPGYSRYEASRQVGGRVENATLEITEERCIDSMSGAHHPFTARLARNGAITTGCALDGHPGG